MPFGHRADAEQQAEAPTIDTSTWTAGGSRRGASRAGQRTRPSMSAPRFCDNAFGHSSTTARISQINHAGAHRHRTASGGLAQVVIVAELHSSTGAAQTTAVAPLICVGLKSRPRPRSAGRDRSDALTTRCRWSRTPPMHGAIHLRWSTAACRPTAPRFRSGCCAAGAAWRSGGPAAARPASPGSRPRLQHQWRAEAGRFTAPPAAPPASMTSTRSSDIASAPASTAATISQINHACTFPSNHPTDRMGPIGQGRSRAVRPAALWAGALLARHRLAAGWRSVPGRAARDRAGAGRVARPARAVRQRHAQAAPVAQERGRAGAAGARLRRLDRGLEPLAARLRAAGKDATVVSLPDNARVIWARRPRCGRGGRAAMARTGARSVDVVGYSAGGVVARIWLKKLGGAGDRPAGDHARLAPARHRAGRARLAGAGQCPTACQQLVPTSHVLTALNTAPELPPARGSSRCGRATTRWCCRRLRRS